ncbi:hypothetical protein HMPREF9724_00395 [Treponema denticola SP37]|uniref:Uncharacterized protein n=1 Tax=Treponema denticola (strain ATCC 35405 / DSM 14222 / CIP 103919 / JCM 8153 / KCTC 15104) TaxID=243275 RepID=Q73JP7_TREDE|nr:hypothetical protein TDE_2462 [Treponema denticola ATCC 35405]EMB26418.1 hypothetical protein HMPREF9724_00395 [Treponema denticola SP37]EMB38112.1 hypothetical protein HMPREF9721_01129 [Treponema denticola ATCC 35404]EMB40036.1 hypothetical protein HMPREF9735_00700 [Treponema denticola ATCC 33521]EMB47627.1 hypothetical protein HMPREF9729_00567 [Treponema denticola ASLM]EMD55830.1 hypothetical protein HMPREF9728_02339 [Treponema denticola US-Trep]EPF33846.1 hypothetical protein HMPREF9734
MAIFKNLVGFLKMADEFKIKSLYFDDLILNIANKVKETL